MKKKKSLHLGTIVFWTQLSKKIKLWVKKLSFDPYKLYNL